MEPNQTEELNEQLREKNERINFILEGTRTATWEWNVQTGECIFNKRWAEIIGYTLEEISPTTIETWKRFAHPDDLKLSTELIEKHFMGEIDYYECETRMKHKDGYWVWVLDRGKVSKRTGDGKPIWMLGTHQDISERKQAEEALIKSNDLLSTFISHSPIYAFIKEVTPAESRVLRASENYIDMIGIPGSQMDGKNMQELFPPEFATKITADDWEVVSKGKLINIDEELNGRYYTTFKFPIKQGEKYLLAGYTIDMTSRKETETLLNESEANARAIMESTDDVFVLLGNDGTVIDCNEAHAKRLNTTRKELLRKNVFDRFPTDVAQKRTKLINEVISSGKSISSEDFRDGHWNEYVINPIFIDGEITDRVAIFSRDITDRKQAEAEIKLKNEELTNLNATKDKFFTIIAHDLKSPFNSILGFSDLLVENLQNNDLKTVEEYAGIIQKASARAMDLLLNLLVWSQSQTGRIEFKPDYVEIDTLIHGATEILSNSAKKKSIKISSVGLQNISVFVDKSMISSVLRNLISNAVKFTHLGGEVVISTRRHHNEVLVTVSDNGVGIKKEAIEKLFRIDMSYSTKGTQNEGGTGLGLILCKEFVEKHGGKIWVESEVDKGSTFCFTIPKN